MIYAVSFLLLNNLVSSNASGIVMSIQAKSAFSPDSTSSFSISIVWHLCISSISSLILPIISFARTQIYPVSFSDIDEINIPIKCFPSLQEVQRSEFLLFHLLHLPHKQTLFSLLWKALHKVYSGN